MRKPESWPVRPLLEDDESYSSWFSRAAWANGLRPSDLYRAMEPGQDRDPGDLDRYVDDHSIGRVAEAADIDPELLRQTTFQRWSGNVFAEDDGIHKLQWLYPVGRRNGKRCYGQQLCPRCLATPNTPYLRLTWRLMFVSACPTHGNLLLDRCPACNEPLNVLRQFGRGAITCWACGYDLRQASPCAPPIDPLPTQARLLQIASQGWAFMGEYGPVYAFLVFAILAHLNRLLTCGHHAHALRTWVSAHEPTLAIKPESIPRAREGALLSPRARSVLVPMASWLMDEWPTRFVAAAEALNMSSRDLLKKSPHAYPFAYAHVVENYLREPSGRHAGDQEVAAAKEILHNKGQRATRRALAQLLGTKAGSVSTLAERTGNGASWGNGRYWKLDGVSPEVKAAARIAAHRAGEGVGTWIDALVRQKLHLSTNRTIQD
ncbi:MAG: TniQ family protein [Rhodospirillaceae bacterium]|nr:TniQ family protein [Rhodospirillaceae bacterium]